MKLNQLAKATKMYEGLKMIDKEIVEIEKLAMIIANKEGVEIRMNLNVSNPQPEQSDRVNFDTDGSLVRGGLSNRASFLYPSFLFGFDMGETKNDKKDAGDRYTAILDSVEVLQILGVLVSSLQARRDNVIRQLSEIGVKINQ